MFASDFVDSFSRTHFLSVPILYVPAALGLSWYALARVGTSWGAFVGLFLLGVTVWTLTEYRLHRTHFHWVPDAPWGERFHFFLHGVHHTWPRDRYRLVMPPGASIPLFFLFLGIYLAVFGKQGWSVHAGFVIGYMTYDLMHYYVHHGRPKHRLLRKLQGHHMSHHFNKRYADKRYGVSSPLWDVVFRTR
jgi:sterol desaturase/sphingolipid hydroxylase (fatty acid hydroxylase superfamily)